MVVEKCILNNILKYMYSKKNIGKILKSIRHMEIDEYVIKIYKYRFGYFNTFNPYKGM